MHYMQPKTKQIKFIPPLKQLTVAHLHVLKREKKGMHSSMSS